MLTKILSITCGLGLAYGSMFVFQHHDSSTKSSFLNVQQDDVFKEIMSAIPSPVEISELIKTLNTDYPKDHMRSTATIEMYGGDQYKQALNLGVYSADLGFASIFKKNTDALKYLDAVKDLSKALSIGNFFDAKAVEESRKAIDNGTITEYASVKIDQINSYLLEKNRQHVSALMLTGGWVEAIYISAKVYQKSKNPKLREAIGDQKVVLEQLLVIFGVYGKSNHADLIAHLKNLKKVYDKVQIETVYSPSQTVVDPKTGELTVEGGNKSVVKITDENVNEIDKVISEIRNYIVKN